MDSEQLNIWLSQLRISYASRSRNLRNLYLKKLAKNYDRIKKKGNY